MPTGRARLAPDEVARGNGPADVARGVLIAADEAASERVEPDPRRLDGPHGRDELRHAHRVQEVHRLGIE